MKTFDQLSFLRYCPAPMIPLVHHTTLSVIPKEQQIPPTMMGMFLLFHKVHATWSYYRHWRLYSNPDNFGTLLAGHAVHHYLGDSLIVRVAAQSVLIVTRILNCAEQYRACYREYARLNDAIRFTYPIIFSEMEHPFIAAIRSKTLKEAAYRIHDIAHCTLKFFLESFKLSLCYMDAIEALSFSAETRDEGIKHLFYNSLKFIDTLAQNKKALLNELKNNREIISIILKPFPGSWSVETLISGVSHALDGAERVSVAVKQSSIWHFMKQACYDILSTFELPTPFTPYRAADDPSLKKRERFPPKEIITFSNYRRKG